MVSFNPYMRPTIEECLSHPFFEKIRRPVFESQANEVIDIHEIDSDSIGQAPTMTILRKLIMQEIKFFQQKRLEDGPTHIHKPYVPVEPQPGVNHLKEKVKQNKYPSS